MCLHFLDLLQYEHFRREITSGQCAKFIEDQQLLHWQHYIRKRMRLLQQASNPVADSSNHFSNQLISKWNLIYCWNKFVSKILKCEKIWSTFMFIMFLTIKSPLHFFVIKIALDLFNQTVGQVLCTDHESNKRLRQKSSSIRK